MKKKKRRWGRKIALLIVLALLGAGVYFIGLPIFKASVTTTYDTYTATIGSISNSLSFSGSFAAVNSQTLYAQEATTVRTLYVAEGDSVSAGDRLARLANGETLKADFDGRVNALSVSEGDGVDANTAIMQVVDFAHMQVSIRIDEYDISEVSVGQACTVTATAAETSYQSEISSINYVSSSQGNVAYYTAVAEVEVDGGVYPGMQATVTIPQEQVENAVILKMDALSFAQDNSAYVFCMDEEGQLYQQPVEVGVNNGNYVEIVSGLSEGDTVYVEVEQETASAAAGLLSGLFGSNQFNPGGMGGGQMPSMDGMQMPSMDGAMERGGMAGGGGRMGG